MINKSKLFSVKAIVTIIILALIAGGAYVLFHKNAATDKSEGSAAESGLVIKSSGLDASEEVRTVGDVEKVMAKWVEANPEAIISSVVAMQQKAVERQQQDAQKNISTKKSELFKAKNDPSYTPSGYNVTLVEFFDYNCGYCKRAQSTVEDLIAQDKKVRIVFKELPILGPSSVELSKVAIAVNLVAPDKYLSLHNALMKGSAKTKNEAIAMAKSLGIDADKLNKALESKKSEIEAKIKANQELATSIGINGTPAFVIGDALIPGAVELATLKEKIAAERK